MYVKFSTSDRDYFLPFFDVFCAEVQPVRRQKSGHVYNVGITNDVMWTWCQKMMGFGYSAWILACHVMYVNQW